MTSVSLPEGQLEGPTSSAGLEQASELGLEYNTKEFVEIKRNTSNNTHLHRPLAERCLQQQGTEVCYRKFSLWPIQKRNRRVLLQISPNEHGVAFRKSRPKRRALRRQGLC